MSLDRAETGRHRYWDGVYDKDPTQLSWYQPEPTTSLELIDTLGVPVEAGVLDVGGGSSALADELLVRGFSDLSVLDVSGAALNVARRRLGSAAQRIQWIHEDLLHWTPTRRYDLWHDRAVFHFLVDPADQERYRDLLAAALRPGAVAILATFGADGPSHCSGLPVARYEPGQLVAALGDGYECMTSRREAHTTPAGVVQPFTWVALQRSGCPSE